MNSLIHIKKRRDRGSVSMMCLIIMVMAIMISMAVTMQGTGELQRVRKMSDAASALCIAEAGVNYTVGMMQTDSEYAGTGADVSFADGTFNTTVTPGTAGIVVHSTGKLPNGAEKSVDVTLTSSGSSIFPDGAIVSNGGVSLAGNAGTSTTPSDKHVAHVHANLDISGTKNCSVDGSAIAAGTVSGKMSCYDTTYPHGQSYAPKIAFPSSSQITAMSNGWMNAAMAGGTRSSITGSATITGPVYINGNISLSGNSVLNIVGNGTVYVNGNVSMAGNACINNACNLVASGTVSIAGNGYYRSTSSTKSALVSLSTASTAMQIAGNGDGSLMGVMYAVNGGVKINGNGTVCGSVLAGGTDSTAVSMVGNANIKYPAGLNTGNDVLPKELAITSWLEE